MTRVEVGTETFDAIAVPAEGAERDRLWERISREEPGFAEYQMGVQRRLPAIVLERSPEALIPTLNAVPLPPG